MSFADAAQRAERARMDLRRAQRDATTWTDGGRQQFDNRATAIGDAAKALGIALKRADERVATIEKLLR